MNNFYWYTNNETIAWRVKSWRNEQFLLVYKQRNDGEVGDYIKEQTAGLLGLAYVSHVLNIYI